MAFFKKFTADKGSRPGGFSQSRGGQFRPGEGNGRSSERNASPRNDYRPAKGKPGSYSSFNRQDERVEQDRGQAQSRPGKGYQDRGETRSFPKPYDSRGQKTFKPAEGGPSKGRSFENRGSFGRPAPSGKPYGRPAPSDKPYSRPMPSEKPYGRPSPSEKPYGRPAPSDKLYGRPTPSEKPYGRPAPSDKLYSRPAPSDNSYGRPAPSGRRVYSAPVQQPAPIAEPFVPAAMELPENLLSGRNPIREAIKTGRDIEKLMVAEGDLSGSAREILSMAKNAGIIVQTVERSRLDQITRNHQGMIAFASAFAYSNLDEILNTAKERNEAPFIVILDKITDPMNLGAIIRSAACVGAHGVIVQQHRAVGLTPSAVRASAGAVEHVKVARVTNINQTIRELKSQGIWVYAADVKGEDYRKVNFSGACALVIGSEGEGISQLTLDLCDQAVSIPMSGVIDSLNASVAAGILLYGIFSGRAS